MYPVVAAFLGMLILKEKITKPALLAFLGFLALQLAVLGVRRYDNSPNYYF